MKKKLLIGIFLVALLWYAPFSQIELASGTSGTFDSSDDSDSSGLPENTPVEEDPPASEEILQNQTAPEKVYKLTSSVGLLTYYSQSDERWAGALYGGRDRLAGYGCGPTVMAMLVTSFTGETCLPSDMAEWASANNYWSPGSGTKHDFIPECAAAFGFKAEAFQNYTQEGVLAELTSGNILVALMGPGHFTTSGHFIIIADYWSGSQVRVADPASLERTQTPWDLQLILDELNYGANGGGPLWSISPK